MDESVETLLHRYVNGLDHESKAACEELERRSRMLDLAKSIIERGVELMTLEQLSEWDGVRVWQESM